jgi:hypothetical protein
MIVHHGNPCRHGAWAHECPNIPCLFAMPAAQGSASLPEEHSCDQLSQ